MCFFLLLLVCVSLLLAAGINSAWQSSAAALALGASLSSPTGGYGGRPGSRDYDRKDRDRARDRPRARSPVRRTSERARSRSPVRRPEYAVRVPLYPFVTALRDYSDIARRYPHLSISPDFVKLVFKWPEWDQKAPDAVGSTYIRLDKHAVVSYTRLEKDKAEYDRRPARDSKQRDDDEKEKLKEKEKDSKDKQDSKEKSQEISAAEGDKAAADATLMEEPKEEESMADPAAATGNHPVANGDAAEDANKAAVAEQAKKASPVDEDSTAALKGVVVNGVKWVAKGVLLCGLNNSQVEAVHLGPGHGGGYHLARELQFVALKHAGRTAELSPLGGPWDPDLDGGEPGSGDVKPLIAALTRHMKRQVGLDLSSLPESDFTHFADYHFSRPGPEGMDPTFAAAAAAEAGVLKHPLAKQAITVTSVDGAATSEALLSGAFAPGRGLAFDDGLLQIEKLESHDPAGHVYTQITVMFIVDVSCLMPPSVKEEPAAVAVVKAEADADTMQVDAAANSQPETNPKVMEVDVLAPVREEKDKGTSAAEDAADKAGDGAAAQQEQMADAAAAEEGGNKDERKAGKADDEKKEDKKEPRPKKPASPAKPSPPSINLLGCRQHGALWEPHMFTLNSLLDYEESDDSEAQMELALMAEGFHEMLMKGYGDAIARALLLDRPATWRREVAEEADRMKRREERRQREEEDRKKREDRRRLEEHRQKDEAEEAKKRKASQEADKDSGEGVKKQKTEDGSKADEKKDAEPKERIPEELKEEKKEQKKEGAEGSHDGSGSKADDRDTMDKEPGTPKKAERTERGTKAEKRKISNKELLAAFRYFDKTGTGYLRVEDMRRIVHNLGAGLPHRAVKSLVHGVADPTGGWRGERLYYRDLTDIQVKEPKKVDKGDKPAEAVESDPDRKRGLTDTEAKSAAEEKK